MPQIYFSKTGERLEIGEDGLATVSLTAHARQELGAITALELPDAGRSVVKGEVCAKVTGAVGSREVLAPLSGTVAAPNQAAAAPAEGGAADPGQDWLFRMRLADAAAVTELLDEAGYESLVKSGG